MNNKILVTGAAGFIGSHVAERLVDADYQVIGLDNFDDFYSSDIKFKNIKRLLSSDNFILERSDIRSVDILNNLFKNDDISTVIHLAARAGVRPSIEQPLIYQDINVKGTINLLEASRIHGVKKFIFISSSSVYGLTNKVPFNEDDKIDSPTSPYASSKAAAELYCRTYNHLYGLPIIILRLFTVYGPRQRPEMAIHRFTKMIDSGKPISLFGDGSSQRDYTYIEDIVNGIQQSLTCPCNGFEIINLANTKPITLEYLVSLIQKYLGKQAKIERLPMQPGDMLITSADISKAKKLIGYQPKVSIEEGLRLFVEWFRDNKGVGK